MRYQKWIQAGIFALYIAIVSVVGFHHEPWFDEAHAWLLARDASLWELMVNRLRYEGTPGLWHILLKVLITLHLPYGAMTVLAVACSIVSTYLIVFRSPFPLWAKVLLPFGFFLGFQYAVVARSYVLLPPLLFGIAALWRKRLQHPVLFYALLALLSQANLHGALLCISIGFIHIAELLPALRTLSRREQRTHAVALGLLAALLLMTAFLLIPAPDSLSFARNTKRGRSFDYLLYEFAQGFGGNTALTIIILGLSGPWLLLRKRLADFLLLVLPLVFLFTFKYSNVWHFGILYVCWVFIVWLALEQKENIRTKRDTPLLAALLFVSVLHALWGALTMAKEVFLPYSGSKEVAEYIRREGLEDDAIAVDAFNALSILPYFEQNIVQNFNGGKRPAFWTWQKGNPFSFSKAWIETYKPEAIIISIKEWKANPDISQIPGNYLLDLQANGFMLWKGKYQEYTGFLVYRRMKHINANTGS